MRARRRWAFLTLAAGALLVVGFLVTSSSGPVGGSTGPRGTLALRRLLHQRGVVVLDADAPPDGAATFVVMLDLRDGADDDALVAWATRAGGTLVVADPASGVASALGVLEAGRSGGFVGSTDLAPACVGPDAIGVARLVVSVSDTALRTDRAGAVRCFASSSGSYEVSFPSGIGRVMLMGGSSPFTNEFLDQGDDAAFALTLLSGPGPVVFGGPIGPSTPVPRSAWQLLPAGARAAVVGAVLVAVAFALVRARRLGRPADEGPLSPIPAGELVRAKADLYRVAGDRRHAGRLLREALLERLRRRAGLPAGSEAREVAAAMETEPEGRRRLERALNGSDPTNDDALIALGRDLEVEARRAGTGGRW
jgi:hypothetical protein